MTSSGIPLGYLNRGWPDPDPAAILELLREADRRYQALPRQDRILTPPIDPKRDVMVFEADGFRKPPGTLDLRILRRGLPYPGMTSFDQRHPMYHHVDRLWFRPDEWSAFIPTNRQVGQVVEVSGPARDRIVLLSHMQAGGGAWWKEHIVGGKTTSEIVSVRGNVFELRIRGDYRMKANTQWNKGSYDGNLLAYATFDATQRRFIRFDLAMLGTHDVGTRLSNLHAGDLTSKIAVSAELAFPDGKDDGRIPSQWKYGYGLRWSQGR